MIFLYDSIKVVIYFKYHEWVENTMINPITSYSSKLDGIAVSNKAVASSINSNSVIKNSATVSTADVGNTPKISTLARQLADSAARAEVRDATLSRTDLLLKVSKFADEMYTSQVSPSVKAKHDSEVPNTDNPELLARAKQATDFLNKKDQSDGKGNPFSGLSRDQLANITYDVSGLYTFNERFAASYESDRQEQEWRVKLAASAQEEYNSVGTLTNAFTEELNHFKILPVIEQTQYPANYAADLQTKIDSNFNYRTNKTENKEFNLFDLLFKDSKDPLNTSKSEHDKTDTTN
jgi:hypothetical protein